MLEPVASVEPDGKPMLAAVEAEPCWLDGTPMDPAAERPEPVPRLPGWPFLPDAGAAVLIVGPSGGGRSSLVQSCLYDQAAKGLPALYLGFEVGEAEFQARAAALAGIRGDRIDGELRERLAVIRYADLGDVLARAMADPRAWREGIAARGYRVVAIDPLSAVESALGLDFQSGGTDFLRFFDSLVQPLTAAGVTCVLLDNVGHSLEAKSRARGSSAKLDRADLAFSCSTVASPAGLRIKAVKVRSTRAGIRRDDAWIFTRDDQKVRAEAGASDGGGEVIGFRPTGVMERVSRRLEEADGALSKRTVRSLVSGRASVVDLAVHCLVSDGFAARVSDGYVSRRPFREGDRVPADSEDRVRVSGRVPGVSRDVSQIAQGGVSGVSHPLRGGDTRTRPLPCGRSCECVDGGEDPVGGVCQRCFGAIQ
ncbi:AAA family ATPase [Conexibacter sp. DBS9H8]|uniref:AAA family ATPase n=1 Tax=Conexibacter sp. DBS9H8 TaxID=2937801 RepID=UPI00200C78E0|nr:AAA family ATPase [Conexibacter sp. DBS9H8]